MFTHLMCLCVQYKLIPVQGQRTVIPKSGKISVKVDAHSR